MDLFKVCVVLGVVVVLMVDDLLFENDVSLLIYDEFFLSDGVIYYLG